MAGRLLPSAVCWQLYIARDQLRPPLSGCLRQHAPRQSHKAESFLLTSVPRMAASFFPEYSLEVLGRNFRIFTSWRPVRRESWVICSTGTFTMSMERPEALSSRAEAELPDVIGGDGLDDDQRAELQSTQQLQSLFKMGGANGASASLASWLCGTIEDCWEGWEATEIGLAGGRQDPGHRKVNGLCCLPDHTILTYCGSQTIPSPIYEVNRVYSLKYCP